MPLLNFLEQGRKDAAVKSLSCLATIVIASVFLIGAADLEALPSLDLKLLLGQTKEVKVGDAINVEVLGISAGTNVTVEIAEGSVSLEQAGITISQGIKPNSFIIVPLKPGEISIPALLVKSEDKAENLGKTKSDTLNVKSAIEADDPEPEKPAALRPPLRLDFPVAMIIGSAIIALLVFTLIIWLVVRLIRRRRDRISSLASNEPPKPEDEVALAKLLALDGQQLPKKELFKQHYFGISEILKEYIGRRFGFDALESTTAEIISRLEQSCLVSDYLLDKVKKLFEHLDVVKFTDFLPSENEANEALVSARQFIFESRRIVTAGVQGPMVVHGTAKKETVGAS